MADQEVIKHTKKVYKIWNSKEHSFFHKLREFIVEILIIVFAVSLSIWLHDRSERAHQQEEVKVFLTGLKEDLANDVIEMRNDIRSYEVQKRVFDYVTSLKKGEIANNDTVKALRGWIFSTTKLIQNNGRFEGFKSSGKIGLIEDPVLQNNITDLYQEDIPSLFSSTDVYLANKDRLFSYIFKNRKRVTDTTSNLAQVLSTDEAFYISLQLADTKQLIERYEFCIRKMETISAQIDNLYNK